MVYDDDYVDQYIDEKTARLNQTNIQIILHDDDYPIDDCDDSVVDDYDNIDDDENDLVWVDEKTARLDQTNMLCPLLAEKR